MPPISLGEPTGRYLSFAEREEIALLRAQELGVREIGRRLRRDPGTISRELRRNAATRSGQQVYRALVAQWKAQQAANVRSPRNWWATTGCVTTCKNGSPGACVDPTARS
jgi:IS30 family transposase